MKLTITQPYDGSPEGTIRRRVASWKAGVDTAWFVASVAWIGLTRYPLHLAGAALGGWAMIRWQWWPPLALTASAAPAYVWHRVKILRVVGLPWRKKENGPPTGGRQILREYVTRCRRWRRLRRNWATAALHAGITSRHAKGSVPQLRRAKSTPLGIQAEIACGMVGVPASEVASKSGVLAARIPGCRRVTSRELGTPMFAQLHFIWASPLSRVIPLKELPLPPAGQLAYGITEDGNPATIDQSLSLFVAGMTGSGKSTVLWSVLASALASRVPFRLWVIDPKGGIELSELEFSPLTRRYARKTKPKNGNGTARKNGAGITPGEYTTNDLIAEYHMAMVKREEYVRGTKQRKHVPSDEQPLEILLVDELRRLQLELDTASKDLLNNCISQGRASSFMVLSLAQVTQKDEIGNVRDYIPQRICLRTPNRVTTDAILGEGSEGEGARCSDISKYQQGRGWAVMEDGEITAFRGAMVTDAEIRLIAQGKLPAGMKRQSVRQRQLDTWVIYGWYAPDQPPPEFPDWKPNELLYIGKSNDGERRTREHMRDEMKEWARVPGVTMKVKATAGSDQEVRAREAELIRELHPRYNKQHRVEQARALPPGPSVDGGL